MALSLSVWGIVGGMVLTAFVCAPNSVVFGLFLETRGVTAQVLFLKGIQNE